MAPRKGRRKKASDPLASLLVGGISVMGMAGEAVARGIANSVENNRLRSAGMPDVDRMSGPEFERWLATLFRELGWRVETTKASGDYGADLILTDARSRIAVQAKRYGPGSSVGISAVQEVLGAVRYYNAHRGMVVTNSTYTEAAAKLAKASGVELWDRETLTAQLLALKKSREQRAIQRQDTPLGKMSRQAFGMADNAASRISERAADLVNQTRDQAKDMLYKFVGRRR